MNDEAPTPVQVKRAHIILWMTGFVAIACLVGAIFGSGVVRALLILFDFLKAFIAVAGANGPYLGGRKR